MEKIGLTDRVRNDKCCIGSRKKILFPWGWSGLAETRSENF